MNKSEIKEILRDQRKERERVLKQGRIIERDQVAFWSRYTESDLVKVAMGVRRSGKTVFSHLLLREREPAFANFDDERLAFVKREELNSVLEALYELYGDFQAVLLDEVQNVPGWELFVNRLQRSGMKVFVTGSNANLLSRELSTHLTGRHLKMEIYPFSFREYLRYNGIHEMEATTRERARLKNHLEKYIRMGGFPEVVKSPEISKMYLSSLYSSIISKDIIARHNIRFLKTFREMATTVVSNFSRYITFNKLRKTHRFKSVHTAKNYVGYLSDAYLVFLVEKYSPKPKEIANSPKKVYVVDTGLINTLSTSMSENRGGLMENLVFLQLLRKRTQDPNMDVYYWKDYQDREIDFLIRKNKSVTTLLQVTYASGKDEIASRETRSLLKGSTLFDCKNLMIITWDYEGEQNIDGQRIEYVPLWKWLLSYSE